MIEILGIPFDDASSFRKGCRDGPNAIREAFRSPSTNSCAENELPLDGHPEIRDVGDLLVDSGSVGRAKIRETIQKSLEANNRVLALGGDHSITYPILAAHGAGGEKVNVLQFDAHPDLYGELDGDRYSHACPFARAHEDGLIGRHVQIGIRTMNPHQRKQAERFNVEVISMQDWMAARELVLDGPFYLTLDLDVLDPSCVPGVSHYEPGGATVRDILNVIHGLSGPIVGADIVELNPSRDFQEMTARVAAKLMKEILAVMLQN